MASRFVVCKDKEEAQKMSEIGLLYLSFRDISKPPLYELGPPYNPQALARYGTVSWPVRDFAYLVEEDE